MDERSDFERLAMVATDDELSTIHEVACRAGLLWKCWSCSFYNLKDAEKCVGCGRRKKRDTWSDLKACMAIQDLFASSLVAGVDFMNESADSKRKFLRFRFMASQKEVRICVTDEGELTVEKG